MAKAKPKPKAKPTVRKPTPHPPSVDRHANYGRKPYGIGDTVTLNAEVNGTAKGTKCEVMDTQYKGAVFIVRLPNGMDLRVKGDDLT